MTKCYVETGEQWFGPLRIVWFDSLGAKSASILIKACSSTILVDPGVAVMHSSFPASMELKTKWYACGLENVTRALEEADTIVITHYHHDHYLHEARHLELYYGKTILAKNPNEYINLSQRQRALELYENLYRSIGVEEFYTYNPVKSYVDPIQELPEAASRSFGDYDERRRQLLEEGGRWFERLTREWRSWRWIREVETSRLRVYWADGRSFETGCARLSFTQPLFHGVEYSRVGWVVALTVDTPQARIFYSSDVNGPIVEDYASLIIGYNPDILILDGPPTYLLGYMLNRVNLRRAVSNAVRILREAQRLKLMVYDHHLVREPRFRERTIEVWREAEKQGVRVSTAAELLGLKPAVLEAAGDRGYS